MRELVALILGSPPGIKANTRDNDRVKQLKANDSQCLCTGNRMRCCTSKTPLQSLRACGCIVLVRTEKQRRKTYAQPSDGIYAR